MLAGITLIYTVVSGAHSHRAHDYDQDCAVHSKVRIIEDPHMERIEGEDHDEHKD